MAKVKFSGFYPDPSAGQYGSTLTATRNNPRGEWTTATTYEVGDIVSWMGGSYQVTTRHLSTGSSPELSNFVTLVTPPESVTGAVTIMGELTRPTVTLPKDESGVVTYTDATGTMRVKTGSTDISNQFDYAVFSKLPVGLVATINAVTGVYAVTGGLGTDKTGTVVFSATGKAGGTYAGKVTYQTFSLVTRLVIDTIAPATPSGLTLTSTISQGPDGSQVALLRATWTANTEPDLGSYVLAVREGAGNWTEYQLGTGTTVWESTVRSNVSYSARLRAIDKWDNRSNYTGIVTHTTTKDNVAPGAPTGLAVIAAFRTVFLEWTNPTDVDLTNVIIQENTVASPTGATQIATVNAMPGQKGSYTRSGLTTGQQRFYRILAVDSSGNVSGYTTWVGATTEGASNGDILNNALTANKFAEFVRPVEIFDVLPTTGNTLGRMVFLTSDGKLYRWNGTAFVSTVPASDLTGTINTGQIADGSISGTKFASGLKPVEIVSTLPTTGNFVGRIVFLTTDNKLYRFNGTAFVASVQSSDITGILTNAQIEAIAASKITGTLTSAQIADLEAAKLTGTITATQISDGSISTPKLAAGAVTAGKIAALTITAGEIAANAITSGKIEAGAVSAGKIAAGSISALEIAADTITGDKIAANAITASELAADSVTAGAIVAGAISTSELAANAVTADKIAALTITADKIAANAITANKLKLIPGGTTVNSDPGITDPSIWSYSEGTTIVQATGIGAKAFSTSTPGGFIFTESQPIDATKAYRVSLSAFASAGSNRTAFAAVQFTDANGVTISGNASGWPNMGSYHYFGLLGGVVPSSNTTYEFNFGAGQTATIPVNARYVNIGWLTNAGGTTGTTYYNSFKLQEVIPAELIVDGAIIASKLAVNAVTAGVISAGAVTAQAILAGAVTTDKMTANSIAGDRIAAGTLAADRIVAGSITGDRINTGTSLPGTITVGSTGVQIGTVSQKVQDGLIYADTRATNSPPSFYIAKGTGQYAEFKTSTVIGLSGVGVYSNMVTTVGFADLSGGPVRQEAQDDLGRYWYRYSTSASTWSAWRDTAAQVNAGTTTIDPGKILITGSTTLANWRNGADNTKIEGGNIATNTISANKINIGSRGISIENIEFQANAPVNTISWTTGYIIYTNDAGTPTFSTISAGSASYTGATVFIYWLKGGTTLLSTTSFAVANGTEAVPLATYSGGTGLVVNKGGTIIDGSKITTGTIDANRIKANTILSNQIVVGSGGPNLSTLANVNRDGMIAAPGGAYYNAFTPYETGFIKIVLPQTFTNTMMKFVVDIFEYEPGFSCTLEIAGYTFQGPPPSWAQTTARVLSGNVEYPVRFGYNSADNRVCIWIGQSNTSWTYPKVAVRDFMAGHVNAERSLWESGWVITLPTVYGGVVTGEVLDTLPGADWNKVQGVNRPANNATVGAPAGTTVGTIPATSVAGWAHPSNTTTIDGGDIFTDTVRASSLSSITANIGLLRTAASGARTEIDNNGVRVFAASGGLGGTGLRVRLGLW